MKKMIRKMLLISIFISLLVCTIISISYAYYAIKPDATHLMEAGASFPSCVGVNLVSEKALTLSGNYASPIQDMKLLNSSEDILNNFRYEFRINNSCNKSSEITVAFAPIEGNTMPLEAIKYLLVPHGANPKNFKESVDFVNHGSNRKALSSQLTNDILYKTNYEVADGYVLGTFSLASGTTQDYDLYVWIDYYEGDTSKVGNNNNITMNKTVKGIVILSDYNNITGNNLTIDAKDENGKSINAVAEITTASTRNTLLSLAKKDEYIILSDEELSEAKFISVNIRENYNIADVTIDLNDFAKEGEHVLVYSNDGTVWKNFGCFDVTEEKMINTSIKFFRINLSNNNFGWSPFIGATSYKIFADNVEILEIDSTSVAIYDLLSKEGTYNVFVEAYNSNNELLVRSNTLEYSVKKINVPDVYYGFTTLSENEKRLIDVFSSNVYSGYSINYISSNILINENAYEAFESLDINFCRKYNKCGQTTLASLDSIPVITKNNGYRVSNLTDKLIYEDNKLYSLPFGNSQDNYIYIQFSKNGMVSSEWIQINGYYLN